MAEADRSTERSQVKSSRRSISTTPKKLLVSTIIVSNNVCPSAGHRGRDPIAVQREGTVTHLLSANHSTQRGERMDMQQTFQNHKRNV